MKISVLIKDPGGKPRHVWVSDTLENLQSIVGGYIETVTIAENLVILCNEEGRIRKMPYNCRICGLNLFGTIMICGVDGDRFSDLPLSWGDMKILFANLWREQKEEDA